VVVQRFTPDAMLQLLGRTLQTVRPGDKKRRLIGSAAEYVAVLRRDFGLDVPEAASLWPRICARHDALFAPLPA
jgi:N-hydroxyarylamine O-acetyltransferase